ncbi:MAG: flocculation-associated PEP-CTERM protein PepA, partial [Hyphomonadaceae bacterium]|nr:flocculation-associated PEP-CTERM protein PepA [Hyphomonadaceae bacterium]
ILFKEQLMKLHAKLVGALAALSMSSAFAVPAFEVPGGQILDPFGGIDWASNGSAFTTDFNQAKANSGTPFVFNMTYFSFARATSGILDQNGNSYSVPNLFGGTAVSGSDPFELTIVATFQEQATCFAGGLVCTFTTVGVGSFDIYLDTAPNATIGAAAALSQYNDGTRIIGGLISAGPSGTFNALAQNGSTVLQGPVVYTNNAFINPNLVGSTATGTLQIGGSQTGWLRPDGIVGPDTCNPLAPVDANCTVAFQADANQTLRIPEPGTVGLLGAAFAGIALGVSRKRAKRA